MVTGKLYDGVDVPEHFISKPAYTPKELEQRFAQFFKYVDAEDTVNKYYNLPPSKQLAEVKKLMRAEKKRGETECEKLLNATLDILFLKD